MSADAGGAGLSIRDFQTGVDFLAQLPLANPVVADQQLRRFLDALIASPPDPSVLLPLLEKARVPLSFVEEDLARRYHNKPLPLSEEEESWFRQVLGAWQKMGKAYALCARLMAPDPTDQQFGTRIATILHRCLHCTGMIIGEHYKARRELPPGIWLELHGFYETAERWGVATTPVDEALDNAHQVTHCTAAYTTALLIEIANPYSNSVRNLKSIRRWAGMWSPLVSVHPLEKDLALPSYLVELMKDAPLHPSAIVRNPGEDARRLDTKRLGSQIRQTLSQLAERITPSQLGLGEEMSGQVTQLLETLTRPWSQQPAQRRFRRFAMEGAARVALGFEAMHFHVSGAEFVQPDSASTYSRSEFDQLYTFRHRVEPARGLAIEPTVSYPFDEWSVVNHSANGFRLARSSVGEKLAHSQLMTICPHDGDHFLLAQATWLMQDAKGGLIVGVATLPGMPTGIGIRQAKENPALRERFERAFLLPPVPAIREDASVVLPAGMYQASRILEVFSGQDSWLLRLKHILQRGFDFDRVSYERL